jgi:hypothetical protein
MFHLHQYPQDILAFTSQTFEISDFPEGSPEFQHTMIYLITSEEVRSLCVQKREPDITQHDLCWMRAKVLPPERLWPIAPPHFRKFSGTMGTDVYVKGLNLGNYTMLQSTSATPADLHLQEATIFETLLKQATRTLHNTSDILKERTAVSKAYAFANTKKPCWTVFKTLTGPSILGDLSRSSRLGLMPCMPWDWFTMT